MPGSFHSIMISNPYTWFPYMLAVIHKWQMVQSKMFVMKTPTVLKLRLNLDNFKLSSKILTVSDLLTTQKNKIL